MLYATTQYLESLVRELSKMPKEAEWIEFKCNNADPEKMAKYVSGISNAAALFGKTYGYLVWGINDDKHKIVGTNFDYQSAKKGNEELEAWLARMINPKINFKFYSVQMDKDIHVVILEIPAASIEPTKYGSVPYIRIGTNLKPLNEFKEKERELWRSFDTTPFELRTVKSNVSEDDVLMLLDYHVDA